MRQLLITFLLLIGCNGPEPQPRQDEALQLVWVNTYGQHDAPPTIYWWKTNCPYSTKDKTAVVYNNSCYSGLTFSGDYIEVAWRGSFYRSAFAHELMHALQLRRGYEDPDHEIKADWELEGVANVSLMSNNL